MNREQQINIWYWVAAFFLLMLFQSWWQGAAVTERIPYSRFLELLEQARIATNPKARQQLYASAMQIIYNDVPWVFLHSEQQVTAIRREVQGFVVHPTERLIATEATFRTSAER